MRIFENEFKTAQQVASLTKEDIVQRRMAFSLRIEKTDGVRGISTLVIGPVPMGAMCT